MKRKTFTLVEILVVIAVIAILMGILFPTIGMIREKASYRQSQTEANSIKMAVKSFLNEYQYLPDRTTGSDVVYYGSIAKGTDTTANKKCGDVFKMEEALQTDYLDLFNTLCYSNSDPSKKLVPPDESKALNQKKTPFLTPDKNFTHAEAGKRGYRDPWGRPYIVMLDTNRDDKIELPGSTASNPVYVHDVVAVIGLGTFDYETNDTLTKALAKPEKIATSWQ